jgi:thymidine phosphorylase|tara:strand:+ start:7965 stop:9455 length:1491 start_codon:yes stop_codon:yes gene_type:complete
MLKIKRIAIDTHPENVALLSRSCSLYRAEDFQALRKIEVVSDGKQILANLIICDDCGLVAPDELGLGEQAFRRLGLPEGETVRIAQAPQPRSLESIRAKINGHTLSKSEIEAIITDITAYRYSPMEIAAFLISSASFSTTAEMLDLTEAMAKVGNKLDWEAPIIVDKHCIGGIPGNRTSMIVVPIVAAHGLPVPKTSSRAITSPAGTADTMEVLAEVNLSITEMRAVVEREKGCLVWGGHVNLSPADDILISVERPLRIDTPEQMVASIISKKLAAGSTHLVIDIPVGPTAKVRSHADAIRLRKMFEYVGDKVGLIIDVMFSDGAQPIGRGIGPVLEARDVMAVLRNAPEAPQDLRDHALLLAGRMLDFDPELRGGSGHARACEILDSGQALGAMERIIKAQGPSKINHQLGALAEDVSAPADGVIQGIDCYRLGRIARLAGAPLDKGAGVDLLKKTGDRVTKGEPIYRIYACVAADFRFATKDAAEYNGYIIGPA